MCRTTGQQTEKAEFMLESASDNSDEEPEIPVRFRKKRETLSWILVQKFDSKIQAKKALDEENTWSFNNSNELGTGRKTYYRCNKVKKRGVQCPAKLHLFFDSSSDAVLMYKTKADHDHESKDPTTCEIPKVVKSKINKRKKAKAIKNVKKKIKSVNVPTITQLRSHVSDLRRALNDNNTINLGDLKNWLTINSVLPKNSHEAFVLAYYVNDNDAAFRFVLSSKYLLKLAREANILHADATNKLVWQGYPVLIVGTTDKCGKFHPLCLAVCTTDKEDFRLIFKSMKEKIRALFSSEFNPTVLVSDGSEGIINAFTEEFQNTAVRMCWTHARRQLKLQIESGVDKCIQKNMLEDIDSLHSITQRDAFKTACDLFVQKYAHQSTFITYFKEQWVEQNWYLGAAPISPPTNNALEGFSKVIKDSNTTERLQLSRFLTLAKEVLKEWSAKYTKSPEENFIAKSPVISLKEWADGNNWAKLPNEIIATPCDDKNFIYLRPMPSGEAKCRKFDDRKTFDEFKEQYFSKWEVKFPINNEKWDQSTCTCPTFFRTYMCEHVIGLPIRLKYAIPPHEAKELSLGQKRKRGRP